MGPAGEAEDSESRNTWFGPQAKQTAVIVRSKMVVSQRNNMAFEILKMLRNVPVHFGISHSQTH